MSDLSLIRHLEIFDAPKNNVPVHIIGCGATGSRLWLSLVELGMTNISAYDFDIVEAHNLANQIFLHRDIGLPKVEGLRAYYKDKTGKDPLPGMKFHNIRVGADTLQLGDLQGIVFMLTDTMSSRREIFDALILPAGAKVIGMIETRMASSYGDVYTVNPFDSAQCKAWVDSLIDDADAEMSACGSSISVGPTASIIANFAVWQMIHMLTNDAAQDREIHMFLKPFVLSTPTPVSRTTPLIIDGLAA